MSKKPRIQQKKIIANSELFQIESLNLLFSNGEKRKYERITNRHKGYGAVLIVPLLNDDTLLLIREYYAGTENYELAFPKGKIEQGENLLHAANREMMEEVGYEAADLQFLKTITLAPGYMTFSTHIVLARNLSPKRMMGDEPEILEVVPWKLKHVDKLVQQTDFTESRSLSALYLVRNYLQREKK